MTDSLKLTPRTTQYGCGIYEAGDTDKCYVKLFVTDTGYVLPVNHRVITDEDLLSVYVRGLLDGRAETDNAQVPEDEAQVDPRPVFGHDYTPEEIHRMYGSG